MQELFSFIVHNPAPAFWLEVFTLAFASIVVNGLVKMARSFGKRSGQ